MPVLRYRLRGNRQNTRPNYPEEREMATTPRLVQTPRGNVHVGDYVHYHGSVVALLGQIFLLAEVDGNGRLTLENAVGGHVRNVRAASIGPVEQAARAPFAVLDSEA